jgi:hypothetical protein
MMSLGSKEELGHNTLMLYLAVDMLICGKGSKRGEGEGGGCRWKRYTYIFLFRASCVQGGGLSRLRGVVYHRGLLSACRWLSHLREVASWLDTIVAKTSSNPQTAPCP